MKVTKSQLKRIIKEELKRVIHENNPLAGPTRTGPPQDDADPLAGPTRTGPPQEVKKKAVALDKVETLLARLLKQIREL